MQNTELPLLLEPSQLAQNLDLKSLIIVDLCKNQQYLSAHIPGAIHIEYPQLLAANPPVMGLLPAPEQLKQLAQQLGLNPDSHIVAYDDEGGGKAARLLWTLDAMGHNKASLLNGGLHAWSAESHPMESSPNSAQAGSYELHSNMDVVADKEYVLSRLGNADTVLVDARSEQEFTGVKKFAEKAGHIPGAVNLDWLQMIDQSNHLKLKSNEELATMYAKLVDEKNKDIVVYCQTHHRSALTYFVLKYLGYTSIRGYAGSWSDWGNSADTPIEV